ncbi:MAG: glutaminyl-peptide cyclotransferase [Sedimenticolaceae bacterium]
MPIRRTIVRVLRTARRFVLTVGVPRLSLQVIEELPHDPQAFTQGLCYVDGCLLESTGRIGSSTLRRVDPAAGKVLQTVEVPDDWGEGIALIGDEVIQLSYKTGIARRYHWPTLERRQPDYHYEGEGWGLVAFGQQLLMSDGSARLRRMGANFSPIGVVCFKRFGIEMRRINDLAWDGKHLLANVLSDTYLYRLDPSHGSITGVVDCRPLVARVGPMRTDHVLNGITATEADGEFLLTGKCWPKLFRVRIAQL